MYTGSIKSYHREINIDVFARDYLENQRVFDIE